MILVEGKQVISVTSCFGSRMHENCELCNAISLACTMHCYEKRFWQESCNIEDQQFSKLDVQRFSPYTVMQAHRQSKYLAKITWNVQRTTPWRKWLNKSVVFGS